MAGSGGSLLRQALALLAVSAGVAVVASPAFGQDRAPEPAPPKTSAPKPEPPPAAKRQAAENPAARVTQPPPAPPPAPPATPPPAVVTPPPAALVTRVAQPPAAPASSARRETRVQRREPAKPKVKSKPDRERTVKLAGPAALPTLSREEATSPDTMLMVGGLALFVLVLADLVFLTLSTRVLRVR